jgi:hypothetical protein
MHSIREMPSESIEGVATPCSMLAGPAIDKKIDDPMGSLAEPLCTSSTASQMKRYG